MKKLAMLLLVLLSVNVPAQISGFRGFSQNQMEALSLCSRGKAAADSMNFKESLSYYSKALSVLENTKDTSNLLTVLLNVSSSYLALCDYVKAFETLDLAEALAGTGDRFRLQSLHMGILKAKAYMTLGNYEKSINIDRRVFDTAPEGSSYHFASGYYLALSEMALGRYAEAGRYVAKIMDSYSNSKGNLADGLILSLKLLDAGIALKQKDMSLRSKLEDACEFADSSGAENIGFDLKRKMAAIYEDMSEYEVAAEYYALAVEAADSIMGRNDPVLISLLYGQAKCLLFSGKYGEAMDAYLEYSRRKIPYMSHFAGQLRMESVYPFWRSSNEGLSEAALFCSEAGDAASGEFISEALDIAAYSKVYLTDPAVASGLLPHWESTAACLSDKSLAVEFSEYDAGQKIGAFVFGNSYDAPLFFEVCDDSALAELTGYGNTAEDVVDSCYSGDNMRKLYELVWKPLEPVLKSADTIYFSPAGRLNFIPAEYFMSDSGKMFCQEHQAIRLSSTSVLQDSCRTADRFDGADVFVNIDYDRVPAGRGNIEYFDFLESSQEDESNLKKILGGNLVSADFYVDDHAGEYEFKHLEVPSGKNFILHISSHGYYYTEKAAGASLYYQSLQPDDLKYIPLLRSGVALSGANRSWRKAGPESFDVIDNYDGILTAAEIASLDLSGYGLVVLAACESGLGDLGSDGISGLLQAFKLAGAGKILASLWSVNDKSAMIFVKYFYDALMSGKSPETSLRMASERLRSHPEFSSPYHWAPYILVG